MHDQACADGRARPFRRTLTANQDLHSVCATDFRRTSYVEEFWAGKDLAPLFSTDFIVGRQRWSLIDKYPRKFLGRGADKDLDWFYAASRRLTRYSIGLREPRDILMLRHAAVSARSSSRSLVEGPGSMPALLRKAVKVLLSLAPGMSRASINPAFLSASYIGAGIHPRKPE